MKEDKCTPPSTVQQRLKRETMIRANRLILEVNTQRNKEGDKSLTMPEFLDSALECFEDARKKYVRGEK